MDRKETARYKHLNGYNCAQAALCAFADRLGISDDEARQTAALWGGGRKDLCGAVYAMEHMIRETTEGGVRQQEIIDALESAFTSRFGSVLCADIKIPGQKMICNGFVGAAAEIAEKLLEDR